MKIFYNKQKKPTALHSFILISLKIQCSSLSKTKAWSDPRFNQTNIVLWIKSFKRYYNLSTFYFSIIYFTHWF